MQSSSQETNHNKVYGLPKIIHSDQDIRFTSPTGWYRSVMRAMGTEVQFGTPYLRTRNPLCERRIGCFKTVMRILMLNEKSRNWLKLVPYAIYLMNNQVSSRTGVMASNSSSAAARKSQVAVAIALTVCE